MDKNLPANAGDMGSSPGPGRSHMPRSNEACEPQLLSLCSRAGVPQPLNLHATTAEPAHLKPMLCNKRSHHKEKPARHNKEQPPLTMTRESPCGNKDPMQPNK